MKISPSAVLALAGVVATGTAFTPLSAPSRTSVGVVGSNNAFQRPVSFLKSTETEEASNAETYEYVFHANARLPWSNFRWHLRPKISFAVLTVWNISFSCLEIAISRFETIDV